MAHYGLSTDDEAMTRPLIGMVSRMVDQKGFDLIAALAGRLPELDASFVVLGTGEAAIRISGPCSPRDSRIASAADRFDEGLAHLVEGGADISSCRRSSSRAGSTRCRLRYGTVPVVREVGGLADTVRDYGSSQKPNGFVFRDYTPPALLDALTRAGALPRPTKMAQPAARRHA